MDNANKLDAVTRELALLCAGSADLPSTYRYNVWVLTGEVSRPNTVRPSRRQGWRKGPGNAARLPVSYAEAYDHALTLNYTRKAHREELARAMTPHSYRALCEGAAHWG